MNATHRLAVAALLTLLPLTACTSSEEKEPDVNPQTHLDAMKQTFVDVMAAAAPEADDVLSDATDVPCGGLGGNEWNKIKYTLQTVDGIFVDDPSVALAAARSRAEELGFEVRDNLDGDGLRLSGDNLAASLRVDVENGVHMSGETPCVDNPDR